MNGDAGNSNGSNLDNIEQFRNRDALNEGIKFLSNGVNRAEQLARNVEGIDGETLGEKYRKARKQNEEFPSVAYLLVLPIFYKLYLQRKENEAAEAIDSKKKEYETFLKNIIAQGRNTPENIKQELDTYSKEKLREMSKKIIEKQSALFDEKMGTMDINQIEKVMNNLQTQISSNKGIDMQALATCLSEPAQTAKVSGQAAVNVNALVKDRKSIVLGADAGDIAIKNAINGKNQTSVPLDENGKNRLESLNIKVGDCFDINNGNSVIPAKRTVGGVQLF